MAYYFFWLVFTGVMMCLCFTLAPVHGTSALVAGLINLVTCVLYTLLIIREDKSKARAAL